MLLFFQSVIIKFKIVSFFFYFVKQVFKHSERALASKDCYLKTVLLLLLDNSILVRLKLNLN